jgi:hypothetical protein
MGLWSRFSQLDIGAPRTKTRRLLQMRFGGGPQIAPAASFDAAGVYVLPDLIRDYTAMNSVVPPRLIRSSAPPPALCIACSNSATLRTG